MKTLQNNFTTPEQSKRLLELGLPADSADFHYIGRIENCIYHNQGKTISEIQSMAGNGISSPCWSVGRLIEIYEICFGGYFNSRYFGHTLMEDVLLKIEEQIDSIDFSRLEE